MARYKLIIEYDGTNFSGWQKQPDVRTVEGVIEEALTKLYQAEIDIVGQGRTDAGVHAIGQCAHADLPDHYDKNRILHAMKGLLPKDVALHDIESVHPDFHARFHAESRSYRYRVIIRPSPLQRFYSWHIFADLNEVYLNKCAELVLGEHDFINFCIPSEDEFMTTICNITESRWIKEGEMWNYEITGNRFLRHLVRRLVGTMVQVAKGEITFSQFQSMLSKSDFEKKGYTAPAKGLVLVGVTYH